MGGRFDEGRYVFLTRTSDDAPSVAFQRVPETKTVKNRVHLDCTVVDLEDTTAWVVSQGGEHVADHDEAGYRWRVVLDPEGNEFCLVPADQS